MNAPRIAILGNPDGWYVKDLRRAAVHEKIEVVSFRDLSAARVDSQVITSRLAEGDGSKRTLVGPNSDFDRLLVRTMPLGSLEQIIFRMNALHQAQRLGEPLGQKIVNPPRCLEIAIDKWLTLEQVAGYGIPVPMTYCCQTRDEAMEKFFAMGNRCVVKPIFGGEGRGIMRVDDVDVAWRVFSTLEQLSAAIYLQEYCESVGYDLRLLFVGDEFFCVKRFSERDWRTNVARGGQAAPHTPSEEQIGLARGAMEAVGGSILGVDILPTRDGRNLLLEVNAVPGWRATASALNVDIARKVLDWLR